MQAKDVMTTKVITVTPDTAVPEIARSLLAHGISAVPVVDAGGRLVGIVSEGDLLHRAEAGTERPPSWWLSLVTSSEEKVRDYLKSHGLRAAEVMSKEVVTVSEDTPLQDVAMLLETHRIKRVPVLKDGALVGIVSRANLLHGLIARTEAPVTPSADDRSLRNAVMRAIEATSAPSHLINVLVTRGQAQIWGLVATPEEADAVRVAAQTVPGIKNVESHVTVLKRGARTLWA